MGTTKREKMNSPADPEDEVPVNLLPLVNNLDERTSALFQQVFGIDLLREKILGYLILEKSYPDLVKVSQNAFSCRLVQHSWLKSVNKCLVRAGKPLICCKLVSLSDLAQTSTVNQLLNAYSSSPPLLNAVPIFSLRIVTGIETTATDCFRVLGSCFRYCATGLLHLEISSFFDPIASGITELPVNVSLPVLQEIVLYNPGGDNMRDVVTDDNSRATSVIQSILSACKKLSSFWLCGAPKVGSEPADTLRLPRTVTNLCLERGLISGHLEQLMMTNTLPNLTKLCLKIPASFPDDCSDSIYRILDLVRLTLKELTICGPTDTSTTTDNAPNPIMRFPIMKSLVLLIISCFNWQLADRVANLGISFPVVKDIQLLDVEPSALRRLTDSSRFESVQFLFVTVLKNESTEWNEDLTRALAQFPQAFPKTVVLHVTSFLPEDTPLLFQPILKYMTALVGLYLNFHKNDTVLPYDFWCSLLLGMPPSQVSEDRLPNITNLTNMNVLILQIQQSTNLPDEIFEFGLLKMPNLRALILPKGFKVSAAVAERWKQAGKFLLPFHINVISN